MKPPVMMMISPVTLGWLAAIGASLLWAIGISLSKTLLIDAQPLPLLIGQLAGSSVFLAILCLLSRPVRFNPRTFPSIALIGLLEPGLAYIVFLIGLQTVSAGEASILGALEAPLIMIFSSILYREKHPRFLLVVVAGALAGAILAAAPSQNMAFDPYGAGLVFLATAIAGLYVTLMRRVPDQTPALVIAIQHSMSLLLLVVAALVTGQTGFALPFDTWLTIGLFGIVQYALPFLFYLMALRRLSATAAAFSLNLIPVFGIAIAITILQETIALLQLLGGLLVVSAGILINRYESALGVKRLEPRIGHGA